MFAFEGRVSDKLAVIGVIQPQAIAFGATGVLTAAIDMQDWERVICVAQSGTLGSSGTLDVKAVASATSGGTYAALTGKSARQLVKATDDNKVVVIEVTQDDVAKVEKRYVKINMVLALPTLRVVAWFSLFLQATVRQVITTLRLLQKFCSSIFMKKRLGRVYGLVSFCLGG